MFIFLERVFGEILMGKATCWALFRLIPVVFLQRISSLRIFLFLLITYLIFSGFQKILLLWIFEKLIFAKAFAGDIFFLYYSVRDLKVWLKTIIFCRKIIIFSKTVIKFSQMLFSDKTCAILPFTIVYAKNCFNFFPRKTSS